MTKLDLFLVCLKSPWNNTKNSVTWKIVDGVMYFQQSKEKKDWKRNICIIPTIGKIQGVSFLIPMGLKKSWDEIKHIVKENPCSMYVGYSLGGQLAALASALTSKPAVAFGCPQFLIGGKKAIDLFSGVEFIENQEDLISKLPPFYRKGKRVLKLYGEVMYSIDSGLFKKLSGHDSKLYISRLRGVY